jgi:hypothetical protein
MGDKENTLCKSKSIVFESLCPVRAHILLSFIPRVLPWADSLLAFQAVGLRKPPFSYLRAEKGGGWKSPLGEI